MRMKNPPHPGLSVRHDCLEPLGLSVTEGAKILGISRKQLSDIVNCRAGISPEMAIRLDKAFGGGAETLHHIQASYVRYGASHEERRPHQGAEGVATCFGGRMTRERARLTAEQRRERTRLRSERWRRAHGIGPRKPAQRPWLALGISRSPSPTTGGGPKPASRRLWPRARRC
jgi:antitoxin HigA-1